MHDNYPNLDQQTLDVIATYMADEIREYLHTKLSGNCTPGEFLTAYVKRDPTMIAIIAQEFRHIKA